MQVYNLMQRPSISIESWLTVINVRLIIIQFLEVANFSTVRLCAYERDFT